jgi:hypothetical protein
MVLTAFKRPTIRHKLLPFFLENIPDRFVGDLGMAMDLCIGDALANEPGVHLVRRGVKKRSHTKPTWFSTWPSSQPAARPLCYRRCHGRSCL